VGVSCACRTCSHARLQVLDVLEHNTRKQMAVTIVRCVLKSGTIVQEVEQVRSCAARRFLSTGR
jgi:hypothetical protein